MPSHLCAALKKYLAAPNLELHQCNPQCHPSVILMTSSSRIRTLFWYPHVRIRFKKCGKTRFIEDTFRAATCILGQMLGDVANTSKPLPLLHPTFLWQCLYPCSEGTEQLYSRTLARPIDLFELCNNRVRYRAIIPRNPKSGICTSACIASYPLRCDTNINI